MMEESVRKIIGDSLDNLNLKIDSVKYEKEGNTNYLRICLDSEEIIDINKIVEATHIINPLMDKEDIIKEEYILDIYGKSKGD
jgi:ribosome maturation factor RimP